MKKGVLSSYFDGIMDISRGESYSNILKFFFPEFIASLVLYSALNLLDSSWIAHLKSTSSYATLGVTNTLLHFIIKIAEGLSVGSIILCGQYNGANNYQKVGRTLIDTFWITCIVGFVFASLLYFGAYWIYYFLGVPAKMISLGVPFLKMRAIGIFFTFVYFGLISFFKGIKDTKTPMTIYVLGALVFIFFDYALIFGQFGFPQMKLNGSALATVIQYGFMLIIAACIILFNKNYRTYGIKFFNDLTDLSTVKRLMFLSWPVILDKATMALAYIWLGAMIAPMGKYALASFTVIKDIERFAFLPAIAFAQIITFLASNDYGASNLDGIKTNIKKVIFLASIFVFALLLIFTINPKYFIQFFDKKDVFTEFSAKILPILNIFVFFDLIQLILSAALRGVGDVKIVMWTRLVLCLGCFFPVSYFISSLHITDQALKFLLIYGMFYVCNVFMTVVYINRFRSNMWNASSTAQVNV